ncbi:MAG: C69 family dipeptidase [Thermoguttaceae bacterium]|nr:C69 family dipeptidase [Thermoguttaceae bacterium]MDW8037605.1 C69 family dipeptidase [Thermoguttaceae bacterium]
MCLTVVVGRQATVDGSVLVGHNEENKGPYFVNFRRLPHSALSTPGFLERRSTWPKELRQPRYGFFWSQIPGREYSDSYLNDVGLVIVSNGCPSREDDLETLIERQEIQQEGIGGLLRRLVAEQAGSARQAVELIGRLVEQFGYRDSGRTYVVADPQEAWLVAVVRGRRWLAQRVPDDAAVVVPNVFIFDLIPLDSGQTTNFETTLTKTSANPGHTNVVPAAQSIRNIPLSSPFPDFGTTICFSADLVRYAIQRGWYDPRSDKPFSFREAYQVPERNRPDPRQWWGQQLLEHPDWLQAAGPRLGGHSPQQRPAEQKDSPAPTEVQQRSDPLPWYVRPARKLSVQDIAAILRNQQGPIWLFHPATQETAIFQLRSGLPQPIGCVYWRTVGRPDWSPLLPWYLGVETVPDQYCHPAFRRQLESWNPAEPLAPEIFQPDLQLIWWKFHALRQMAAHVPEQTLQALRVSWTNLEQQLWQQQQDQETQWLALWSADAADCRCRITQYCIAQSETVCQQVDQLLQQWRQEAYKLSFEAENPLLNRSAEKHLR